MTSYSRTSVIVSSLFLIASSASAAEPSAPLEVRGLLGRAAKRVELFWDQFSAITCSESVTRQKLEPKGKVLLDKTATYDYLILLQQAGDDLMVEESRVLKGKAPKEGDRALLTTAGFSTLQLILHPMFQSSYEFRDAGESGPLRKLDFVHLRGHRSPSVFQLKSREYPIEWKGSVWIDSASGAIARVDASLQAPMEDIGLYALSATVEYAPVRMAGAREELWLPRKAAVEAATQRQRWKNIHQFSSYRRFGVDTDVHIEAPTEEKNP